MLPFSLKKSQQAYPLQVPQRGSYGEKYPLTWHFYLSLNTRSVRKVSDRIFLCEHLMDYNLARLHEPTLNLSAHV